MIYKVRFAFVIALTALLSCGGDSDDPIPTPSTTEPISVYIFSVTASPTDQESVTIKNNSGSTQDLSNWKIGDKNDPNAYNIPNGTSLTNGQTKTFPHSTLGFAINDSGETIYLKNSLGSIIDTWTN